MTRHQSERRRSMPRCVAVLLLIVLPMTTGAGIIEREGVVYGQPDDTPLKLDLARPEPDGDPDPALILIHGGGWRNGGREQFAATIREAANHGYAAATIDHRLTEETTSDGEIRWPWPVALRDARSAVRFLRAEAARYHIDPDRIAVAGHSSGGHLALMVGLAGPEGVPERSAEAPNVSNRVQAVINMSGPTEMRSAHAAPVVRPFAERLLGGPPDERPDRYKHASPVNHASEDDPPVLTLHGAEDEVVPVGQAEKLERAMRRVGAPHDLKILKSEGHRIWDKPQLLERMFEFLDRSLR